MIILNNISLSNIQGVHRYIDFYNNGVKSDKSIIIYTYRCTHTGPIIDYRDMGKYTVPHFHKLIDTPYEEWENLC